MTPTKWPRVPIKDVCSRISSGGTPSRRQPEYFEQGTIRWVKSQELQDGPIFDTQERITEEGLRRSSAKLYPPNTVLMAMYGATVGQLGVLRVQASINQAICGMVVDATVADYRYLYYALMDTRDDLTAKAFGAAQQNLNQGLIREYLVPLPPLPIQRRIAAVLSAYDDLIEVNQQRIEALEAAAQALYREWFVEMRFPGYESAEWVESELGVIPAGWEVAPFENLAEIERANITPKDYGDELFEYYSFGAFDESRLPETTLGEDIKSNKYIVPDCCVLLTKLNPHIPRVWMPLVDSSRRSITSTEFLPLIPLSEIPVEFLYGICSSRSFLSEYQSLASGTSTSHQRIKPDALLELPIVFAPQDLRNQYSAAVAPIHWLVHKLRIKNAMLGETRDLLLPRLISGEVSVEGLPLPEN